MKYICRKTFPDERGEKALNPEYELFLDRVSCNVFVWNQNEQWRNLGTEKKPGDVESVRSMDEKTLSGYIEKINKPTIPRSHRLREVRSLLKVYNDDLILKGVAIIKKSLQGYFLNPNIYTLLNDCKAISTSKTAEKVASVYDNMSFDERSSCINWYNNTEFGDDQLNYARTFLGINYKDDVVERVHRIRQILDLDRANAFSPLLNIMRSLLISPNSYIFFK